MRETVSDCKQTSISKYILEMVAVYIIYINLFLSGVRLARQLFGELPVIEN